jgi:hypothetical protein
LRTTNQRGQPLQGRADRFPIHFEPGIEVGQIEVEDRAPEIRKVSFNVAFR